MRRCLAIALLAGAALPVNAAEPQRPVPLIFDTDIGNDIDDALALAVIHALESRHECKLLAVTISKDYAPCSDFVEALNSFYGRGQIPIGIVQGGKTPEPSRYIDGVVASHADRLARRGGQSAAADPQQGDAIPLLRRVLAEQDDHSVVMVVVGFSTNMARLLDSPGVPDARNPALRASGVDLVAQKVRLLSIMAGNYGADRQPEYNVHVDLEAARALYARWPTPIVASGFEVGLAIKYPATSIERDYIYSPDHPVRQAYELYLEMPYDRETWDLTSVLYAVRPDRGYFGLSEPGTIHVADDKLTHFTPSAQGPHRYLTVDAAQIERVREALVQLASQPPGQPAPVETP